MALRFLVIRGEGGRPAGVWAANRSGSRRLAFREASFGVTFLGEPWGGRSPRSGLGREPFREPSFGVTFHGEPQMWLERI